jgi:hypothetical protein
VELPNFIAHGKTGLVFELNSASELRAQIERLLVEPGLLNELKANIPLVKSIQEEMLEIVENYEALLKTRDQ